MPDNEPLKPASGSGRRRRGRRGGRGRGRGPRAAQAATPPAPPVEEAAPESPARLESVAQAAGQMPSAPLPQRSAINQAIDEISEIITALKRVLEQMEEVLELAELAERQKTADEQEIETLRRALRQLHRPGGSRRGGEEIRPT